MKPFDLVGPTRPPTTLFEVPYPFVRELVSLPNDDMEGPHSIEVETWRPGTRFEDTTGQGDVECYADGMGRMLVTVVSEHKPGKFPTRVFFTRQWEDPDGKRFGKSKLRISTRHAFNVMTRGYRHSFELVQKVADAETRPPTTGGR